MSQKILWLVVARAGSKSIPDKNIKLLSGIPLLAHRIRSAKKTKYPESVWVSTDSKKYANIALKNGAQVNFIRPKLLAQDNTNSADVVLHAMNYAIENNYQFDYIGLLEPTSPFITSDQLDKSFKKLISHPIAESIVAVRESRPNTIFIQDESIYLDKIAKNINKNNKIGRQNFRKQITPSGGFYISKWESFLNNKTFYTSKTIHFLVDEISALEIDEPIDFLFAEFISQKIKI
jgi:CMP-N,N'-diacetyllegionaminic acid synthase